MHASVRSATGVQDPDKATEVEGQATNEEVERLKLLLQAWATSPEQEELQKCGVGGGGGGTCLELGELQRCGTICGVGGRRGGAA